MKEIVIKIDDVDYEYIKNGCIIPIKVDNHIYDAIRNGIVLVKGHGRLIDADELIKQLEATANIEWNKQVGSSKGLEDAIDIVDDAPTIIEADKEE